MADEVYVQPVKNTDKCTKCKQRIGPKYHWRVSEGDDLDEEFDNRSDAIEAALGVSGDLAVVLLRADGSRHGELKPAAVGGGGLTVQSGTVKEDG